MIVQCTFCDIEGESFDDEVFDSCKENNHKLLEFFPETLLVNTTKQTKTKSKKQTESKVKGFVGNKYYIESIILDDKPQFLVRILDSDDITIKDSIELEDKIIRPLNSNEYGYLPYKFSSSDVPEYIKSQISTESLIDDLKIQTGRYIVSKV